MMTTLVVTEKERMALNIAGALGPYTRRALSGAGRRRPSVYEVSAQGSDEGIVIILPLSGHIMNYVTRRDLDRWTYASVDRILDDSESLVKVISGRGYYSAIRSLAERSSKVIIATDSDEEGENIGLEVIELLGGYRGPIRRLWLNTTIPSDIRAAFSGLREFNRNLALSVEARRKIDATVGFAGTRELTLRLRRSVAGAGGRGRGRGGVLSFGRVQTSTLWMVVQREKEIRFFVPRPYWEVTAEVDGTRFVHESCPIFDRERAFEMYEGVKNEEQMLCTGIREEAQVIQPPRPLNTAEMLRAGSNVLHISPGGVLSLAEDLYLGGKITYPRVDNQTYTPSFDHRANLEKLTGAKYGEYARSLLERSLTTPTRGRFSEDHEPVTPIAVLLTSHKDPLAYRLYELVLRHYLSTFGPPARFIDTIVRGTVGDEPFRAEGRRLVEPGFYGVYYYPPEERPMSRSFNEGAIYGVRGIEITEKKTEPPPRYTESALLAGMEKAGIGTKSTRPMMIETLKKRAYTRIRNRTVFPTERGMKFIDSIEKPWGDYISPQFTARVESEMERVAQGERNWDELVESERRTFAQAIERFRGRDR